MLKVQSAQFVNSRPANKHILIHIILFMMEKPNPLPPYMFFPYSYLKVGNSPQKFRTFSFN